MLGGKFKYVLGSIFLLVLLVVVAEAGFYFGVTRKEKIIPSVSSPPEAPGPAPIIDQSRLAGFEFVRKGMVKGAAIEVVLAGRIKDLKTDRFTLEKDGEVTGYQISSAEDKSPLTFTVTYQPSGRTEPLEYKDLKVGEQAELKIVYDGLSGAVESHNLTVFRQE